MKIIPEITISSARTLVNELNLRDGMVVRGRVVGFVDGNSIINIGGKNIVAESKVPLAMGENIYLKLEENQAGRLVFRLITSMNIAQLIGKGSTIDMLSLLLKYEWKINRDTLLFWMSFKSKMGLSMQELQWLSRWTRGMGLPINWEMARIAMLFYHKSRRLNALAKGVATKKTPKELLNFIRDSDLEELMYWQLRFNASHHGYRFFILPFGDNSHFSWVFIKERKRGAGSEKHTESPEMVVIWVDLPNIGRLGILITALGKSVNVVFNAKDERISGLLTKHRDRLKKYLDDVGFSLAKLGFRKIEDAQSIYFYGFDMEV
ncbi:MAG: flagellar hook-length control protein FliK [Synergistetes bacterium]|nr:flagellar hook-length control protein FliK [Synergistota bacterium]